MYLYQALYNGGGVRFTYSQYVCSTWLHLMDVHMFTHRVNTTYVALLFPLRVCSHCTKANMKANFSLIFTTIQYEHETEFPKTSSERDVAFLSAFAWCEMLIKGTFTLSDLISLKWITNPLVSQQKLWYFCIRIHNRFPSIWTDP